MGQIREMILVGFESVFKCNLGPVWSCGSLFKSTFLVEILIKVLINCLNTFKYIIWRHSSISVYCIG